MPEHPADPDNGAADPTMIADIRQRPDPAELAHQLETTSRDTAAAVPTPSRGYHLPPDQGADYRGPEVRASNRSTGGSLAIYRSAVAGQGPPRHAHTLEDETILVLDGILEVECGDDQWEGRAGSTFFLPRGLTHTFRSVGGPAEFLFIVTPGHLDEFFRLREHADSADQVATLVRKFM